MPTFTLDLNKNKNNTMTTPTVAAPVYTNTATTPAEDPYDKFTTYYNKVYNTLSQQAPTVEYNMTPEAKLRAGIQNSLLPAYRQAIANRQRQTNVERASIDADAAARGMGSSTWVTDAKTRRADSEADDIATMQGNYMSTLASRLADAIYAEKANKLSADQFNANLKANWNNSLEETMARHLKSELKTIGLGKRAEMLHGDTCRNRHQMPKHTSEKQAQPLLRLSRVARNRNLSLLK